MGTRNLTCAIQDGEFKVAQYGQWDGYPDAAGVTILNFLNQVNLAAFAKRLNTVSFVSDEEWNRRTTEAGFGDSMDMPTFERYKTSFPWLNRDVGYKVFWELMKSTDETIELRDDREFACDSLFCEWAYVVDMDRGVFEVYEGFNKDFKADCGVFADVPKVSADHRDEQYAKVRLVRSYSLTDLPTQEEFLEEFSGEEE